ncbi:hypothetical protein CDL12_24966 [Handroanthus impetiginosus]|uniref:Protein BIC1 n=1 Tax=Handroanthus impetiginosus TaxID=429701 RepID=A0A2G9GB38_9LAMI|nr:hypothetical protein CDL12_24966 [Handroanthus impetiginosus]
MLPKNLYQSDLETQIPMILASELKETARESEIEKPFSTKDKNGSKKRKSEEELGHESHEREARRDCSIEEGTSTKAEAKSEENSNGRERLKRLRVEVAGRVWIPEMWGQEKLLKDWIDCTAFDATLMNSSIMSARASLVEEGRTASNTRFRIENRC